jgi:hypothetical protein
MDTTDITTLELGPHALALREARLQALQAYGINQHALMEIQEDHALMIQPPHELVVA